MSIFWHLRRFTSLTTASQKNIICDRISSIICRVSDIYIIHIYIYIHIRYHFYITPLQPIKTRHLLLKNQRFKKPMGTFSTVPTKVRDLVVSRLVSAGDLADLEARHQKNHVVLCFSLLGICLRLLSVICDDLLSCSYGKSAFMEVFFACFQPCGANLTACNFVIRL